MQRTSPELNATLKAAIFTYERNGELCGFAATKNDLWVHKQQLTKDTELCTIIPVSNLKHNLKRLLKSKVASKVEAGSAKAIAVPLTHLPGLCLPPSPDTSTLHKD